MSRAELAAGVRVKPAPPFPVQDVRVCMCVYVWLERDNVRVRVFAREKGECV
jgi:hypothetical protein